ncbi:MAG: hypothetical protein WCQ32_01975 [bacterium]
MKYLVYCLLGILASVSVVFAAAPADSFDIVPSTALPGETVSLQALIYNAEKSDITYTVVFSTPTKVISTQQTSVPSLGAKTIKANFVIPKTVDSVSATIKKAVTKTGTHITSLEKPIGTLSVGPATSAQLPGFLQSVQKVPMIGAVYTTVDNFRAQQIEYFTAIRDGAKIRIGSSIDTLAGGVIDKGLNAATGSTTATTTDANANTGSFVDYATYIFSAMLVQLFSSQPMFYVVLGLLIIVVLRAIFRRVF